VVGTIIQNLERPFANMYIGPGKAEEVKQAVITASAEMVIFDDELSPTQIRNLEKTIEAKVIDRTILILDIFARRARTREAMLQVELAQCKYMMPRIIGLNSGFSRQKSGTGSKGPGEKQLELDRRILKDRISHLQEELNELVTIRRTQREKRKKEENLTVAIAGYTNSGKSTILNKMLEYSIENTEKYVFEKNMLFATLETATRAIMLKNNHRFLVTDTVGFISKLPHHLVEAFKSTLEEIKEANLILHVVDSANPEYLKQIGVVEEVLKNIGVKDVPVIYAFNKTDLRTSPAVTDLKPMLSISATTGLGFDRMVKLIDETLYSNLHRVQMVLPFDKGQIYSFLKENANIFSTDYQADGIHLEVELNDYHYGLYKQYIR
jgi:GTP-binding protein HflX